MDNRYMSMPHDGDPHLKFKIWDILAKGVIAYCPTVEDVEKVTNALNALKKASNASSDRPKLISIGAAAHMFGVSDSVVRKWKGPQPIVLPSGHRRYDVQELLAFKAELTKAKANETELRANNGNLSLSNAS